MFTCANEGLPRQLVGDLMKISNSSIPSRSESSTIPKSEVQRIVRLPIGASPLENVNCTGDVTNMTSSVDAELESTKSQILIIRAQHTTMAVGATLIPAAKLSEKVTVSSEVIP